MVQLVKNLPAMQEAWVWSLGWEDPLEKSMATHSSILAWRIPMDRGAWWAAVHGATKSWTRLSDSARCYRYCDKLIRGERKRWGICASPWKPLFRVEAGPVSDMGCPVHNVIQWITNSRNISKQEVNWMGHSLPPPSAEAFFWHFSHIFHEEWQK